MRLCCRTLCDVWHWKCIGPYYIQCKISIIYTHKDIIEKSAWGVAKSQPDSEMGSRTNNRVFGLDMFRTALVILSISQSVVVFCERGVDMFLRRTALALHIITKNSSTLTPKQRWCVPGILTGRCVSPDPPSRLTDPTPPQTVCICNWNDEEAFKSLLTSEAGDDTLTKILKRNIPPGEQAHK